MITFQSQIYFLIIIGWFLNPLLMMEASASNKIHSEHWKKHLFQDTIKLLLVQLPDASPTQKSNILKKLEKFNSNSFSPTHKEKIRIYLIANNTPSRRLILLAGFLEMKTTLFALAKKHHNKKPLLQDINIALVRAGYFPKANTLRKNIEKLSINDPFVYEVLPLLVYTKERIIYDWLLEQINLDEQNCHPADAEGTGNINCAYRIMEALAPAIIDFPVQLDKWGDLDVDSYSKALTKVRDWINTHQKDYILDKQTY